MSENGGQRVRRVVGRLSGRTIVALSPSMAGERPSGVDAAMRARRTSPGGDAGEVARFDSLRRAVRATGITDSTSS